MNRTRFLSNILGFGLLSTLGCRLDDSKTKSTTNLAKASLMSDIAATDALRKELIAAWHRSENMTMTNVKQMPPEFFTFKYTDEAMTFSEQWRHCVYLYLWTIGWQSGNKKPI